MKYKHNLNIHFTYIFAFVCCIRTCCPDEWIAGIEYNRPNEIWSSRQRLLYVVATHTYKSIKINKKKSTIKNNLRRSPFFCIAHS